MDDPIAHRRPRARSSRRPCSTSSPSWPQSDDSPVVRLYISSALQRLPLRKAVGDSAGLARAFRGRRRPQPAADVLVCRRAAGRSRRRPRAATGRRRARFRSCSRSWRGGSPRSARPRRSTCWWHELGKSQRRRAAAVAAGRRSAKDSRAGGKCRCPKRWAAVSKPLVDSPNAEVNAAGHGAGPDVRRSGGAGQAARRAGRHSAAAGRTAPGARRAVGGARSAACRPRCKS